MGFRIERDTMGEMRVPEDALYGAQTARAVLNFPISGERMPREMIEALGWIKHAAAEVNLELGRLDEPRARAIAEAAQEVAEGRWDAHFPVDVFQTGSGTSTNMNANEVIAHRAMQIAPGLAVHPNDHVNMGQSSNDVIPTAIHLAAAKLWHRELAPALRKLHAALVEKAEAFADVVKVGRTHLMDATPITLGQEISGWARQVELACARLEAATPRLFELAIGGTAVGTGLNTHPEFGARVAARLAERYRLPFVEAKNHFEAQAAQDALVEFSGALRCVALSLLKIANDVRLLNSGPRCGIAEIRIPAVQPGSSIMPGKVNPVIAESLAQVCVQVVGNDAAVACAAGQGLLDLCVMLPVMMRNVLSSERLLARAAAVFAEKCIAGLEANRERCAELVEWSMSLATALAPHIGYERAAEIAKRAVAEGRTVREVAEEMKILPPEELARVLDAQAMTRPGVR
ncbi:MAG: class II fumarate hydratase [Zetaproteobacteria bacterium]|nr:MAG: class II fumarate hydratase [Zetaproteobacteria bacterium]